MNDQNFNKGEALKVVMLIFVFGISLAMNSGIVHAANNVFSQNAYAEDGQNAEALVSTLNETLEENRGLREQVTNYENMVKKVNEDQGMLKNQIRALNTGKAKREEEARTKIVQLEQQIKEFDKVIADLKNVNKNVDDVKVKAEEQIKVIKEDNAKLKNLLDKSILEGERDQYLQLISESESSAERAIEKLSAAELNSLKMKMELASTYYNLGTMLYEQQNYENAAKQYQRAIELNPMDSWAHHNLGIICDYYLKDNTKAVEHYKKYIKLKPAEEEAHKIRERILELELQKELVPGEPLAGDFKRDHPKAR
ncbi:MAG: hypothetical protein A3G33_07990 [Omnitrophica bacterium RIFCSPLOWO2_12_FULL_44_17]|uniref:Uncharacterized protein n=1 Tax=Candidatus Danuiimicrobium aquiferis TaxID=1801832 RepID=A0A1G1L0Z3_9BACT|nr:MAG: hypothetical protein A3G33_07990 [Omnitrophica bacterium RIFCSPLOWO2_12_FULL_44_17]